MKLSLYDALLEILDAIKSLYSKKTLKVFIQWLLLWLVVSGIISIFLTNKLLVFCFAALAYIIGGMQYIDRKLSDHITKKKDRKE